MDSGKGGPRRWLAMASVAAAAFVAVRLALPAPTAQPIDSPVGVERIAAPDQPELADPSLADVPKSGAIPPAQQEPRVEPAAPIVETALKRTGASTPEPAGPEPPKALVYGTATDGDAEPIDGVLLHTRTPAGVLIRAQTDREGRYAIGPLPVGQWTITVYTQDRHCPSIQLEVDKDTELVRRDLVLPLQQMVRVAVVDPDGSPALPALRSAGLQTSRPALVAVATLERPGSMVGPNHLDLTQGFGVGRPQLRLGSDTDLGEDTLTLLAIQTQGPTWISLVSHHCVLQSIQIQPDVQEARFVLEPGDLLALRGEIRASIIDATTGKPLAAKVATGPESSSFRTTQETVADQLSGAATLAGVAPGPGWWIARADGFATVKKQILVPRGGTLDLGVVALEPPVSLAGSVRSADGKPLQCILRVSKIDPAGGPRSATEVKRASSGPDGRFRVEGLLPAEYVLSVVGTPTRSPYPPDPALRSSPRRVDATGGSVDEIRLDAKATTRVTFPVSKFEERWPYLEAIGEDGLVADGTWLGRWFDEAWIDVLPASYTLEIRRIDGSVYRQELTIGDQPLRLELTVNLEVDK